MVRWHWYGGGCIIGRQRSQVLNMNQTNKARQRAATYKGRECPIRYYQGWGNQCSARPWGAVFEDEVGRLPVFTGSVCHLPPGPRSHRRAGERPPLELCSHRLHIFFPQRQCCQGVNAGVGIRWIMSLEDVEPSSSPVWDLIFFFSENSTENTHLSLRVRRFDKLSGKFEHWKGLLVRSTTKTVKKKNDGLFIRNQTSGRKGNDDI